MTTSRGPVKARRDETGAMRPSGLPADSDQHELCFAARSCSPALRSNGDAFDPLGRVAPFFENPGIRTARRFLPCRETSLGGDAQRGFPVCHQGPFFVLVSAADYARDRLQISLRRYVCQDTTQDVTQRFKRGSARGDLHVHEHEVSRWKSLRRGPTENFGSCV